MGLSQAPGSPPHLLFRCSSKKIRPSHQTKAHSPTASFSRKFGQSCQKRKRETRSSNRAPFKPNYQKPENGSATSVEKPTYRSLSLTLSLSTRPGRKHAKQKEKTPSNKVAKIKVVSGLERNYSAAHKRRKTGNAASSGLFVACVRVFYWCVSCSVLCCLLGVHVLCLCQCECVSCFVSAVTCYRHFLSF